MFKVLSTISKSICLSIYLASQRRHISSQRIEGTTFATPKANLAHVESYEIQDILGNEYSSVAIDFEIVLQVHVLRGVVCS
jgi:hypothetical protein